MQYYDQMFELQAFHYLVQIRLSSRIAAGRKRGTYNYFIVMRNV